MLTYIVLCLTILTGTLVLYHHLLYPLLLRWLAAKRAVPELELPKRGFVQGPKDETLPLISLLMPAHDEEAVIAEKIRNLAALDYPHERLEIYLICDGCNDETAQIARKTHREPECAHLRLTIIEKTNNGGKLAILNEWVPNMAGSLVALSDVSALVSVDALLAAVSHFQNQQVGVVCGKYRLLKPGSPGEALYWTYQTAIKERESALGSIIGVHGAFYLFRKTLFQPLPDDTINDDFILPMEIVAQGYRAVYEPRINALELEKAAITTDQNRRRRIAAGNLQQTLRLRRLLNVRFGGVFFNFASGKTLRALMPFILLILFGSSAWLTPHSSWFAALFISQVGVYGLTLYRHFTLNRSAPMLMQTIYYLVSGHANGLIGAIRYIIGLERGRWRRAMITEE